MMFQGQYISDAIKDLKQAEFDALKQDNLSVLEYEHKFNQLVRYAPQYHGLEELKAKRFIKGLRPDIRRAGRPFNAIIYHDVVQKALLVEQEEYESK